MVVAAAVAPTSGRVGFTPFVATGIPIGTHRVRITLRGYQPIERDVEVRVDRRVTLDGLVVADVVVSGTITRHRLHYAFGAYNVLDWRCALPAFVFSSDRMPQAGRSFVVSLGYTR